MIMKKWNCNSRPPGSLISLIEENLTSILALSLNVFQAHAMIQQRVCQRDSGKRAASVGGKGMVNVWGWWNPISGRRVEREESWCKKEMWRGDKGTMRWEVEWGKAEEDEHIDPNREGEQWNYPFHYLAPSMSCAQCKTIDLIHSFIHQIWALQARPAFNPHS